MVEWRVGCEAGRLQAWWLLKRPQRQGAPKMYLGNSKWEEKKEDQPQWYLGKQSRGNGNQRMCGGMWWWERVGRQLPDFWEVARASLNGKMMRSALVMLRVLPGHRSTGLRAWSAAEMLRGAVTQGPGIYIWWKPKSWKPAEWETPGKHQHIRDGWEKEYQSLWRENGRRREWEARGCKMQQQDQVRYRQKNGRQFGNAV